jgi:hypothetical protein
MCIAGHCIPVFVVPLSNQCESAHARFGEVSMKLISGPVK